MTRTERAVREACIRLRKEQESRTAQAMKIHNSPSMFLDRDDKCRRLLAEADGIQYAAMVILECLEKL